MKRRLLALTLVLPLILTVSCAQQQEPQQQPQQQNQQQPIGSIESSISGDGDIRRVRVIADNANVRTGCSNNTPVLQTADKNKTLNVVSQVSNWFAVKLNNNQIGFIPKDQCKPIVVEDEKPEMQPETTTNPSQTAQGNGADTTVPRTPAEKTDTNALTSEEQEMFTLVNQARSQNNVQPLQVDMELTSVARLKSQDMIDNNYFSHNSPKYGSPFDMMRSFDIDFVKAGENIAGNQTVQSAHNGLMNSAGHRKNILSPDFTHIGIGIKKGGPYGNIFTQMFVSKPK